MNELTTSDLFFIITGTAVIIITVLVAIGIVYVIMFVRTVKKVANTAQRATELVSEDLADLRKNVKERGISAGAFVDFAKSLARKKILPKKK
jgi:archaellum component FlaF (FlaF/FlaG flagellin family)